MSRRWLLAFQDEAHTQIYLELIEAEDLLAAMNHAKAVMPDEAVFCHIDDPDWEAEDDDPQL